MSPPQKVAAAMPGTAEELAERTGYPLHQVYRLITLARQEGITIRAEMQGQTILEPADPEMMGEEVKATTIFHRLDN